MPPFHLNCFGFHPAHGVKPFKVGRPLAESNNAPAKKHVHFSEDGISHDADQGFARTYNAKAVPERSILKKVALTPEAPYLEKMDLYGPLSESETRVEDAKILRHQNAARSREHPHAIPMSTNENAHDNGIRFARRLKRTLVLGLAAEQVAAKTVNVAESTLVLYPRPRKSINPFTRKARKAMQQRHDWANAGLAKARKRLFSVRQDTANGGNGVDALIS